MNRVAIVDYGLCNLDSVRRAVEECGGSPTVTADPADLHDADRIILPGVGAFGDAMHNLREAKLDVALADEVMGGGAPFLGICLGMHLMATRGFEFGEHAGLGWVDADVVRLTPTETDRRVPHIGWNEVMPRPECPLFEGLEPGTDFYFVHSYHVRCNDPDAIAATTPYCGGFASAVGSGLVWGVQFHPEKSQRAGFQLLRNFLAL